MIFVLDLYSKQVRLIQPLFYCIPAGSNVQRLKSAEMEKHFHSVFQRKREREVTKRTFKFCNFNLDVCYTVVCGEKEL